MFVPPTKSASTVLLLALTCGGACLVGHSASQAGPGAPTLPTLPQDTDAQPAEKGGRNQDAAKIDKMFPDGLVHDFGMVPRGIEARHTFRVVNTSNVPLRLSDLRWA